MPTLPTNPHYIGDAGHVNDHNTIVSALEIYNRIGAGARVYRSTTQNVANTTSVVVDFNAETWDAANFHDNTTNPSRLTVPTGYAGTYLINANVRIDGSTTGVREAYLQKNGTAIAWNTWSGAYGPISISSVTRAAVGDYFTLQVYQNSGSTLTIHNSDSYMNFSCVFLGA